MAETILLIDADYDADRRGRELPNLALLKIGSHALRAGAIVRYEKPRRETILNVPHASTAYVSAIFSWHRERARRLAAALRVGGCRVVVGGLALAPETKLPDEVEHAKIEYGYFGLDYSIGFSSRGCFRKCPFCYVWQTEGSLREHAPIDEILDERHDKLLLLDANYVASPNFTQKTDYLIRRKIRTSISQGIDLRVLTEEKAQLLAELRSVDMSFKHRRYFGAWDTKPYETLVLRGLKLLLAAGVSKSSIYVYVLTGFDTTPEYDMYRVKTLHDLGVRPFVMLYEKRGDRRQRLFAKWVNRGLYRTYDFETYLRDLAPVERVRATSKRANVPARESSSSIVAEPPPSAVERPELSE